MVFQHSGAQYFDLGGGFHYSGSYHIAIWCFNTVATGSVGTYGPHAPGRNRPSRLRTLDAYDDAVARGVRSKNPLISKRIRFIQIHYGTTRICHITPRIRTFTKASPISFTCFTALHHVIIHNTPTRKRPTAALTRLRRGCTARRAQIMTSTCRQASSQFKPLKGTLRGTLEEVRYYCFALSQNAAVL